MINSSISYQEERKKSFKENKYMSPSVCSLMVLSILILVLLSLVISFFTKLSYLYLWILLVVLIILVCGGCFLTHLEGERKRKIAKNKQILLKSEEPKGTIEEIENKIQIKELKLLKLQYANTKEGKIEKKQILRELKRLKWELKILNKAHRQ